MLNRGPSTPEKQEYFNKCRDAVDPSRTDLTSWADLQDLEEGRFVPLAACKAPPEKNDGPRGRTTKIGIQTQGLDCAMSRKDKGIAQVIKDLSNPPRYNPGFGTMQMPATSHEL